MASHFESKFNRPTKATVSWPAWIDGQLVMVDRTKAVLNREIVRNVLQMSHCLDCGESDPVVLQFDHRDRAEKKFGIGSTDGYNAHPRDLLDEIAKCDIRCANCHVRRTAKQLNWWRNDLPFATRPGVVRRGKNFAVLYAMGWAPLGRGFRNCGVSNRWKLIHPAIRA